MEAALKVVSFNVKRDSIFCRAHAWKNRRELVARIIRESNAAIVGVQELMPAMKEDIRKRLTDYSIFGWGRTRKYTDEHAAILLHNTDTAALSDQTIWLSKHPEKSGSRAYFSVFPRICTICEVFSKELNCKIRVFNTHFDHICGPARTLGVRIILEYMHRLGVKEKLPTILMGDFNARPGSKPVRMLTENLHPYTDIHLTNIYSRFDQDKIHNSYHGFRGTRKGRRPIDYIFVSDDFEIEDAYLDHSNLNGYYPSDHFPLVAVLGLKKSRTTA